MKYCIKCEDDISKEDHNFKLCNKCRKNNRDRFAKTRSENICKWITQDNKPCESSAILNKLYCGTHSKYEGIFLPKDIPNLNRCSRCKDLFKKDKFKTCGKCREKKPKVLCKWITKDNLPCPFRSQKDKLYCKIHSIYDNVFQPEDIPNLDKCSTCKNLFKKEDNFETCKKCRKYRKEKNIANRKTKIYCKGITQNNTLCKNSPIYGDDYCLEHQSYKKWKNLKEQNLNVCNDWIRGCFNIIKDKDKSYCDICREKYREKEKKYLDKKRDKSYDFNFLNIKDKMCQKCNKIYKKELFKNNFCHICYDKQKHIEEKRNNKNPYLERYQSIKQSAKKRNINLELEKEYILKLINKPCYFCGIKPDKNHPLGIDRLNSSKSYNIDNCVSCCKTCNISKGILNEEQFIENIKIILKNKKVINDIKINKNNTYFTTATVFRTFERHLKNLIPRNLSCDFNEDYYNYLLSQPCFYCENKFNNGARGIDRINSTLSYTKNNCVSCCIICNRMKNSLSITDFYKHLKKIYNNYYKKDKELSLEDKLINKLTSLTKIKQIKLFHEKFLYPKEYYEKLIWNGDINELRKIKIKLEICSSKENIDKFDIWNYYRRTVSSFTINSKSKLVGKQIYILVKDNTSNKYLGIISLSSDVYSIECRDKYINWNSEQKKKKLDEILNLTTCVPLQPFGFKFNGGKLLAELIFSKEIFNIYKKKYNKDLIGITTFGLYGKSIMYDRLRKLKLIGYTKGNSYCNVDDETYELCKLFLKENDAFNKKYKRFMNIRKTIDMLNLNKCILTSNKKSCYIGFFNKENVNYLNGKLTAPLKPQLETSNHIFKWWINRWAEKRFKHLINTNRLEDTYYSSNYINNKKYEEKLKEKIGLEEFKKKNREKAKRWREKHLKKIETNIITYNNISYKVDKSIKIKIINNKHYLIFRRYKEKKELTMRKEINILDFEKQLKLFINSINKKYQDIIIFKQIIKVEDL